MAEQPADFHDPLQSLLRLLREERIPHVLIGGLAVSQLCRPRFTADIDVLTYLDDDSQIGRLIDRAAHNGFTPRVEAAEQFARRNRVLLLVHQRTQIQVDISLGLLPFEKEVIERSSYTEAGNLHLPLPTVEDLQDIRMLVEAHPNADRNRIRSVVEQFAEALEMPEILADLLALFSDPGE